MEIVHLINHSNEMLGGAQKILHMLYNSSPYKSSIFSFDFITSDRNVKKSSKMLCIYNLMKYLILKKNTIFIVHHRVFLPLLIFRSRSTIFVCHSVFPDKNIIYKFITNIKCIAVSDSVKTYLHKHNNKLDVKVIPNGISVSHKELHSSLNDNIYRIGFVGRLDYVKGIDVLADAFILLAKRIGKNNVELHIVGEGELKVSLIKKFDHNNLMHSVNFYGYSPEPFKCLTHMDVICVPSRYEGFGLVYHEALARNHFVIASSLSVFKKIDNDDRNVLIAPGSVRALSKQLLYCRDRTNEYSESTYSSRIAAITTTNEMVESYISYLRRFGNGK